MIRDERARVVVVWTTLPGDTDPAPFARALVDERLAACVTTETGAQSVYRWRERIEEATEHQLTIKTTVRCLERLERRVTDMHPYDVPEFLVVPAVDGSRAYLDWVAESTSVLGSHREPDRGASLEQPKDNESTD